MFLISNRDQGAMTLACCMAMWNAQNNVNVKFHVLKYIVRKIDKYHQRVLISQKAKAGERRFSTTQAEWY